MVKPARDSLEVLVVMGMTDNELVVAWHALELMLKPSLVNTNL